MTFEVKRSEWIRGDSQHTGLFVRPGICNPAFPERKRCCLGFFANACGISDRSISGYSSPAGHRRSERTVPSEWAALTRAVTIKDLGCCQDYRDISLCGDIIDCNDSHSVEDEKREKKLMELFGKLGHTVVFVD